MTFGRGASTNLTAPSFDVEVALALFKDAFESSVAVLTLSAVIKFDLEVVLLSPEQMKQNRKKKNYYLFIPFVIVQFLFYLSSVCLTEE